MKTTTSIARFLLGFIFLVFGLNGFLNFIPMPPPTGAAGQYLGALFVSHFLTVAFLLEIAGGVLLLSNRFIPLALILLGPVVANILLFHLFLAPQGLPLAVVTGALWGLVYWRARAVFSRIFHAQLTT